MFDKKPIRELETDDTTSFAIVEESHPVSNVDASLDTFFRPTDLRRPYIEIDGTNGLELLV